MKAKIYARVNSTGIELTLSRQNLKIHLTDESIRFYSVQKSEQDIEIGTLDEYEQYLLEHASEEYKPDIREFIKNMRLGKRQFEIRVGENFLDKNGIPAILSLEAVNQRIIWNQSFVPYFRLFARILSEYEMM